MKTAKVNVTALQTVSHGNLDMKQGRVYTMSKGEAQALEKAGFVSLEGAADKSEGTLGELEPQDKNKGDVVVDDAEDMLGGEKIAPAVENKMVSSKSTGKK